VAFKKERVSSRKYLGAQELNYTLYYHTATNNLIILDLERDKAAEAVKIKILPLALNNLPNLSTVCVLEKKTF
jgi:hypothetical protein